MMSSSNVLFSIHYAIFFTELLYHYIRYGAKKFKSVVSFVGTLNNKVWTTGLNFIVKSSYKTTTLGTGFTLHLDTWSDDGWKLY